MSHTHTFNPYSFLPVPPPQAREAHPIGIYTTYYHARHAAQPERAGYYEDPADRYSAPPPQRNWKRDHKRHESSEHYENSGHQHYHGQSWRKEERRPPKRQDGVYYEASLHTQEARPEDDDIYLARLNALRSFGRFILKTVGWFVKTLAFVLIMSFAVGCGAAAGVVLLMVGKPLGDWVAGGADDSLGDDFGDTVDASMVSGDSTSSGVRLISTLPPLDVARAGAVAGAMAFVVPGLLFFLTEVTFAGSHLLVRPRRWAESLLRAILFRQSPPSVYANDFVRDERMDLVIDGIVYVLATLAFAVGVGVWVVVLPPGLKDDSSPESEEEQSQAFVRAIQTSLLGWAVIHVGLAIVLGLAMAVKVVPKWAMERVGM